MGCDVIICTYRLSMWDLGNGVVKMENSWDTKCEEEKKPVLG